MHKYEKLHKEICARILNYQERAERCERLREVVLAMALQNQEIALQMADGLDILNCEVLF